MHAQQLHVLIQTIDIAGRRRWLLWGGRTHEFHLQSLPAHAERGQPLLTLCGRPIAPDSRSVIVGDNRICRHCIEVARARYRSH